MRLTFYMLTLVLFTYSCNSDDDTQQNNEPALSGSWSLIHVSGGLAGVDDDFEFGLIIWDFNINPKEIVVTNNNTSAVVHSGYPSGTYDYEIVITANDTTLNIENSNLKITALTTSQLIIDEGLAFDGFQYTLTR